MFCEFDETLCYDELTKPFFIIDDLLNLEVEGLYYE